VLFLAAAAPVSVCPCDFLLHMEASARGALVGPTLVTKGSPRTKVLASPAMFDEEPAVLHHPDFCLARSTNIFVLVRNHVYFVVLIIPVRFFFAAPKRIVISAHDATVHVFVLEGGSRRMVDEHGDFGNLGRFVLFHIARKLEGNRDGIE